MHGVNPLADLYCMEFFSILEQVYYLSINRRFLSIIWCHVYVHNDIVTLGNLHPFSHNAQRVLRTRKMSSTRIEAFCVKTRTYSCNYFHIISTTRTNKDFLFLLVNWINLLTIFQYIDKSENYDFRTYLCTKIQLTG